MKIEPTEEKTKSKLWKQPNYLLNRSRHWSPASSYKEAREQAIEANIEVQHRVVR